VLCIQTREAYLKSHPAEWHMAVKPARAICIFPVITEITTENKINLLC